MKRLKHFLAHLFRLNTGKVVTWWDIDALLVGFQCDECSKISGADTIGVYTYRETPDGVDVGFKWFIHVPTSEDKAHV
jgi:hypothetical protein